VNKLWNISRFIVSREPRAVSREPTLADNWILAKFNTLIKEVTEDLENYNFSQAGEKLREFTWGDFADWYIEISKIETMDRGRGTRILNDILEKLLIMWHPFIPFVTEVIWDEMLGKKNLIVAKWPKSAISHKLSSVNIREFEENLAIIEGLSKSRAQIKKFSSSVPKIKILMSKLDAEENRSRMEKELEEKERYSEGLKQRLANKEFVSRAPKQIVNTEREKLKKAEDEIKNLREQLNQLR
jgi:valyl-tRNA synthetase